MNKIVVDIKGELEKDDILIYDGETFKPVNKESFMSKLKTEIDNLNSKIEQLNNDIEVFKMGVNAKLKDYHNILQTLTKEE